MAFVRGIHRWQAGNAENVSIWWRYHEKQKKNITSPIVIPGSTTISKATTIAFKNMAICEWKDTQVRNTKSNTPSESRGDSIVIVTK